MELIHIQGQKRYWVVRPGAGSPFLRHFEQNNCIAIGHIDDVPFEESGKATLESIDKAHAYINHLQLAKEEDERETVAQITKRIGTARTFVGEISVGDTILTPRDEVLLVGTVTSDAYIERKSLLALNQNSEISSNKLDFNLRRKVQWEGLKTKDYLPWQLRDSLRSSQAVFCVDRHKELLEHWLYSIFIDDRGLFFSTRISQTEKIKQFHITEFQRLIQKLELVAELIVNNRIDLRDDESFLASLDELYYEFGLEERFTLTTKQSFASPGSIWSFVPLIGDGSTSGKSKLLILALLVQSSFGYASSENLSYIEEITEAQIEQAKNVSELFRTAGHLDDFRRSLKANLDERRKSTVEVEQEELPFNNEVVFPDVSDEGETGR